MLGPYPEIVEVRAPQPGVGGQGKVVLAARARQLPGAVWAAVAELVEVGVVGPALGEAGGQGGVHVEAGVVGDAVHEGDREHARSARRHPSQ